MNDAEFLRGFEACTLSEFHHRDHVRLTWLLVRRDGTERAKAEIISGIIRFAAAHGQTAKYHQTMTEFWVEVVAHHIALSSRSDNFEEFVGECPQLLDKNLPFGHWARETLMDDLARHKWVPPDRLPLPWREQEKGHVDNHV